MLKLTRLNNHTVAINPDHISWVDTTPDTTLFLIGGEKIIVRETLDELIASVVEFRRLIRKTDPIGALASLEGDLPPHVGDLLPRRSDPPPPMGRSYPVPARGGR